jgi:hypothetical protein
LVDSALPPPRKIVPSTPLESFAVINLRGVSTNKPIINQEILNWTNQFADMPTKILRERKKL